MASFAPHGSPGPRRGKGAAAPPPPSRRREQDRPAATPARSRPAPPSEPTAAPGDPGTEPDEPTLDQAAAALRAELRAARQREAQLRLVLASAGWSAATRGRLPLLLELLDGPCRVASLARVLGVSRQATHQVLDGLVREGLVERHPDPTDARAQIVLVTAAGRQLLSELELALRQVAGRRQ